MARTTQLRSIRVKRAMSQEALEEASGVSQAVISKIERNGPTTGVRHAIALAKALGVTVEELFAGESDRTVARPRRRVGSHAHTDRGVTAA
jgi:transcriptional regulator with XRE-family HTH domain